MDIPNMVTIEGCDFPIEIIEFRPNYKVLRLANWFRTHLELPDSNVIWCEDPELLAALPDLGGEASGLNSLLPHQDHPNAATDPRFCLILVQRKEGERGAETLLMSLDVTKRILPITEAFFAANREQLASESLYDKRFSITQDEYEWCFTPNGFDEIVEVMAQRNEDLRERFLTRTDLYNFLIRGPSANELMAQLRHAMNGEYLAIDWKKPGALFINNRKLVHARDGLNTNPAGRLYAV